MRNATLVYVIDNDKILLGMKKRGFGEGKWNGFGGKVEEGETLEEAIIREANEEAGLVIKKNNIEKVAEIDFTFPHVPKEKKFDQTVHVFIANEFDGEIVESEEMLPKWFSLNELPFDQMWKSDLLWLKRVLDGEKLKGSIVFGKDAGTPQEHEIKKME